MTQRQTITRIQEIIARLQEALPLSPPGQSSAKEVVYARTSLSVSDDLVAAAAALADRSAAVGRGALARLLAVSRRGSLQPKEGGVR